MTNIVTEYPVKTLDGLELLPAGTELTEEILEELANKNTAASYESLPFMDYGTIRKIYLFLLITPLITSFFLTRNNFKTF